MTDRQIIRAEIERRMREDYNSCEEALVGAGIIYFIDSMPKEPKGNIWEIPNNSQKEFEEEIEKYLKQHQMLAVGKKDFTEIARHFANWQNKQMLEALRTEYEKGRYDMREEMMKDTTNVKIIGVEKGECKDLGISCVFFVCIGECEEDSAPSIGDEAKLLFIKEE